MRPTILWLLLAVIMSSTLRCNAVFAQEAPTALVTEIEDFLELSASRMAPGSLITDEAKVEIRQQAAAMAMREDVAIQASFHLIQRLVQLAGHQLTSAQNRQLAARLQNRKETVAGQSFRELEAYVSLSGQTAVRAIGPPRTLEQRRLRVNDQIERLPTIAKLVAEWVEAQPDLSEMTLHQLYWCCQRISKPRDWTRSFSVKWRGLLEVPRTGEYEFFASPYDINYEQPGEFNKQSMMVEVDGQTVVDAKLGAWQVNSAPIQLTEGARVPFCAEYDFVISIDAAKTISHPLQTDRSPSAILYWKGPGFAKAVIPASAFFRESGVGSGIQAKYTVRFRAGRILREEKVIKEISEERIEPSIDCVWIGGRHFLCDYPEIEQRLFDEYWARVSDPDYWEACNQVAINPPDIPIKEDSLAGREKRPHRLLMHLTASSLLTSGQRAEFLATLLNYRAIIKNMSMAKAYSVYTRYWHGAPDEAIAFLGTWMQLHPNEPPRLSGTSKGFYQNNRWKYRQITIPTVMQYPEHFRVLLEEYLEMPDGGCCLPVAYSLGYGHLVQGKMQEWIELLDAKLEDELLIGDRRVNWLLARAHAEEIRRSPPSHYYTGRERISAGNDWIVEASLVAETPETQLRISMEQIARLTAQQQWDSAREAIESVSTDESEKWNTQLVKLQEQAAKRAVKQKEEAQEAYLSELKRRKEKANDKGNTATADRYGAMINALESAE